MDSEAKQKILETAQAMVSGELEVVEGCRTIVGLLMRLTVADFDLMKHPAFQVIAGVESETDGFPKGEQRDLWNGTALRANDEELATYISLVEARVHEACTEIIGLLSGAGQTPERES